MLTVQLNTLCNYTNATPASRNMIEGQNIINSGMIIMCGATEMSEIKIIIYSLVLQTSALTAEPHTITGTLLINTPDENDCDNGIVIEEMNCTCKAGSSHTCKHIVGVLLYCNRYNLVNLELLSSTDKKCVWTKNKKPVLEQFEALPTKAFCCVKQDRLPALAADTLNMIETQLIECDNESAKAKHWSRRVNKLVSTRVPLQSIGNLLTTKADSTSKAINVKPSHPKDFRLEIVKNTLTSEVISVINTETVILNDCCKNIFNTVSVCNDVLQACVTTQACKFEWKKERKYRITGSRCYSLYTYSKGDWAEKARKYFYPNDFKSKYTAYGIKLESATRQAYIDEQVLVVQECGLIVCMSEPWLAYSPDGIIIENNQPIKLLEFKCPYELPDTQEPTLLCQCKFLRLEKNVLVLKDKHSYYAQVQFGMALLNLKHCDFVIYSTISKSIKIIYVPFDSKYAYKLISTLKLNYFQKMLHQICIYSRLL